VPSKTKKATFSLHEDVLAAIDEAVADGAARSKNAFVEEALIRQLQAIREQALRAQWEEAARDPLFLQDLAEIERDFDWADAETARSID
jgi:hypothetical protein